MRARNVHYNLEHGFVHNWLVAAPGDRRRTSPFKGENIHQQIARIITSLIRG